MKLVEIPLRRPVTTLMVFASLVVMGLISFGKMPLAFLPEVDIPAVWILVPYPNSNPAQVERLVTKPVEEALATLKGVKNLSSESTPDGAEFQLEFTWGQSIDLIRMAIGEKIDQVRGELPSGVQQIQIFNFSTSDIPVVQARISAEGIDLSKNYELLDRRVADRLRRIKGVGRVELGGVSPKEIRIYLLADKLWEHQVDVSALIGKLRSVGASVPVGDVVSGPFTYNARVVSDVSAAEQLRTIPVQPGVRLGDIARIEHREPVEAVRRHLNMKRAVALEVYKESTANTVDVARAAVAMIRGEIANDPTLRGINIFTWDDQAAEIESGLDGIRTGGVQGGLLAVLILFIFLLRWDATSVVSVAIPLSLVISGNVLYFGGRSLNVLSMTGLMLGVGMLVDNAIVVLESIVNRYAQGDDPRTASINGASQVAGAVTSSTLTSMVVFLPMVVGNKSELTVWLGEIGLTITITLVCSLLVALTLIPLLASRMLGKSRVPRTRIPLQGVIRRYTGVVAWTLRHPWKSLAGLALLVVVGVLPVALPQKLVDTSIFSGTVNKRMFLEYQWSDFFYGSDVEKVVARVEGYLLEHKKEWGIESVYSWYRENHATTVLSLGRSDLTDRDVKALRATIREGLPVMPGVKVRFEDDKDMGGRNSSFGVTLSGEDGAVLAQLGERAARQLERLAGVKDVRTSAQAKRQEIRVTLDEERAARLGITAEEMSQVFAFTLGGFPLRRLSDGVQESEMLISLAPEDSTDLEDLRRLTLRRTDDGPVRVGDIAQFQIVPQPSVIHRENRVGAVSVRFNYEGDEAEAIRGHVKRIFDGLPYPPGYGWTFGAAMQEEEEQGRQMLENFVLALLLVFVLLAAQFESLVHPFAIVLTLPFGLFGVWWMLALTQTPFNLMARIGFLILIGIAVNNGIVLIDLVNRLRNEGVPREEALVRAGAERLRPIMMTALTTLAGLVPLAIGGSSVGDVYYFPLARAVIGGLLANTVLTLLVLPYMYQQIDRFTVWCKALWRASAPGLRAATEGGPLPETARWA